MNLDYLILALKNLKHRGTFTHFALQNGGLTLRVDGSFCFAKWMAHASRGMGVSYES